MVMVYMCVYVYVCVYVFTCVCVCVYVHVVSSKNGMVCVYMCVCVCVPTGALPYNVCVAHVWLHMYM